MLKLGNSFFWNASSLAILGISGLILNFLIISNFGAKTLGIFNQVYALYVILSHFAVGGIHYSVLKQISYNQTKKNLISKITFSAMIPAVIFSFIIGIILFLSSDVIGYLLKSDEISFSLKLVSPGLIFFSINKILLNMINGMNHMKSHALLFSLRYLIILGLGSMIIFSFNNGDLLCLIFVISELVLLVITIFYIKLFILKDFQILFSKELVNNHISFGSKSLIGGALTEIKMRVDVIILGIFLDDNIVGVYSFSLFFAEGIYQFSVVLRKIIDPVIGKHFSVKKFIEIEKLSKSLKKIFTPLMLLFCFLFVLIYPMVLRFLKINIDINQSTSIVAILLLGVFINSIYFPFSNIFILGNKPNIQTIFFTSVVLFNIIGNIILIPILNIYGAAISTASSFIIEAALILFLSKKIFKIKL